MADMWVVHRVNYNAPSPRRGECGCLLKIMSNQTGES
jgi:hypothetical protein